MNVTIKSRKDQLDYLFLKVGLFSDDQELSSHWARYLCVLVYGFIEISMQEIIFDYAKNKSAPRIADFVRSRVRGVWNWNTEKILEIIGSFDPTIKTSIENDLDQELKDALNSVVDNRHKITHGCSVGITFSRINEYYKKVVKVFEIIEQQLNP